MIRHSNTPFRGCTIGCLVLVLGSVMCLAVLIGGWFLRNSSAKRDVDRRMAAIKAQGLPVDDASMQSYYASRTDPADADAWMSIFETTTSDRFMQSVKAIPIIGTNDEITRSSEWKSESETREFLKQWNDLISEVVKLSRNGKPVRFPITFNSLNTQLLHAQNTRHVARLLSVAGHVAVYDRDSVQAQTSIDSLIGLSQVIAGDPILVSQMVTLAIDGMAIGLLKEALEQDVLAEKDLKQILPVFHSTIDISPHWKAALIGERSFGLTAFKSFSIIRGPDMRLYMNAMESALAIPTDDMNAFRKEMHQWNDKVLRESTSSWFAQMDSVGSRLLLPAMDAAADAFVRNAMQHRLATIAIGVRLFEKQNGRMPSSLAELSSLGIDTQKMLPIGEKSFGYRYSESGAMLWGFEIREMESTPIEPPIRRGVDENGNTESVLNEQWVWELKIPH